MLIVLLKKVGSKRGQHDLKFRFPEGKKNLCTDPVFSIR